MRSDHFGARLSFGDHSELCGPETGYLGFLRQKLTSLMQVEVVCSVYPVLFVTIMFDLH